MNDSSTARTKGGKCENVNIGVLLDRITYWVELGTEASIRSTARKHGLSP